MRHKLDTARGTAPPPIDNTNIVMARNRYIDPEAQAKGQRQKVSYRRSLKGL